MKKKFIGVALLTFAVLVIGIGVLSSDAHAGATIIIQNNDGTGEGFNDPTPWTPTGGNPATTLGQARLNAFQYAADIWAQCLSSSVTILVRAQMNPQFCNTGSAVLGSAGATTVHRDFAGALQAATWYSQALANSLAGADLSPADPDINATFNSNLNGDPGCLGGIGWYYGFDRNPGGDIDFVTVVLHEIGHGLGFQTFVNLGSGTKLAGFNDTYMLNLEHLGAVPPDYPNMTDAQRVTASISDPDLVWVGGSVTAEHPNVPITLGLNGVYMRIHAPNPQAPGSSVSHWSSGVGPNEVMEPAYTGANHDPSLALFLMEDIGWALDPNCFCPATPTTLANADTHTVDVAASIWTLRVELDNAGSNDALNVQATMSNGPAWLNILDANCSYGTIVAGTSSFGTPDSYRLDISGWPGGSFFVDLDVSRQDDCGNIYNDVFRQELDPSNLPTAVGDFTAVSGLEQNVPNPFNPETQITYRIAGEELVTLTVYDVSGKRVRTLVNKRQPAGVYTATWNGRDDRGNPVSSGVFFYRMSAGGFEQTRRMVLLK
jgi:hypothetical protein